MPYVGTGEQDVKLWNKGVTIQELTKNLYCSYYLTTGYLFYYRVQYDHKTEKKSGRFREDGVMISAALNKSDVISFQNDLITNKQANYIAPFSFWGT